MPILLLLFVAALLTQRRLGGPAGAGARPALQRRRLWISSYFRTKVQPIFLAKREGHTRCVSCHSKGTPMRLQELSPGATTWNEEQSKRNFQVVAVRVTPAA